MAWFSDLLGTLAATFKVGHATLDASGLTANRALALPDASGTIALAGSGRVRHIAVGNAVHAGDQCTLAADGVRGVGRFPLLGSAVTRADDRLDNVHIQLPSARILTASARLRLAVGWGAAVLDAAGATVVHGLSPAAVTPVRLADDVWFLQGAGLIYDDATQATHAAPDTLAEGGTRLGSLVAHGLAGGFGLYDLATWTDTAVTAFPPQGGSAFVFQGWAASASYVCAVGTVEVAGVPAAFLYEYDLSGTFLRVVDLGFADPGAVVTIQPASAAGDFFVGVASAEANGSLYPFTGGGSLGGALQSFGAAGDCLAIRGFDGSVQGYALVFECLDDPVRYTAWWTGSGIAVSSLYDWQALPPLLLLRSPGGQVFALADDGVPGEALVLAGISGSLTGTLSAPKQPFPVTPGLAAELQPRLRARGLCEPPVFSGTTVAVKGVWGVNGLLKGLAANAYVLDESGGDLLLTVTASLADAGSAVMDTAQYNGYGWRCAAGGALLDLSRSIDGTWLLLDGGTLAIAATASCRAAPIAVAMVDRVTTTGYLAALRVGLNLDVSPRMTTGYTLVSTADPARQPDADAAGIALHEAEVGQPVEVLLWGSAPLALADGGYACGSRRCTAADGVAWVV